MIMKLIEIIFKNKLTRIMISFLTKMFKINSTEIQKINSYSIIIEIKNKIQRTLSRTIMMKTKSKIK